MSDMTLPAAVGAVAHRVPRMPDIPRGRYLDESLYRAEIDHVFRKTWHLVAHTSEFPEAGSYRLLDLPFAPVFIVRGKDGELRAFLNACAHRAATVVKGSEGVSKSLTCQFHGWTFDLTGKLVNVPGQENFQGLELDQRSLTPVRCERWGDMVFVNLDRKAPPLLEWIAPIAKRYTHIAEAPLRVIERTVADADCNWKVMLDAFRESYHVDMTHRGTIAGMVTATRTECLLYPNGHWSMLIPYLPDITFEGAEMLKQLAPLPGADSREFMANIPVVGIFPNMLFAFQHGGFPLLQIWPVDNKHCRVTFTWFGMDWGDGPRPAAWDVVIAQFNQVFAEDIGNTAAIQRASEAEPHKGMPLSDKEVIVYQFHAELDRIIGAEHVPPGLHIPDILGDVITP